MARPSSKKATRRKSSETGNRDAGQADPESQNRHFPPNPPKPNRALLAVGVLILAIWLILLLLLLLFG